MTTAPASAPLDTSLNFESCGGTLHELQDGHIPETFDNSSYYIHYKEMDKDPSVHVYDKVLPPCTVDALYKLTVAEGEPWGTYVTMKQVDEYCKSSPTTPDAVEQQSHESLSLVAVAHFVETMTSRAGTTATLPENATHECLELLSLSDIHGVAVWALASDSREVQYHIDYAELIRYEHNVLAAPIWAGTLQCTFHSIKGGQFAVNLQGLDHYDRHGYKGNKSGDGMGGWSKPPSSNGDDVHWNEESGWVTIPYRYNRMIGHSGHLPHLSAPFVCKGHRVIVGFNVFRTDVGQCVSQAPEHSHAFRRRIQCHRALLHNNTNVSFASIRKNKALTKLLVLAKREKVKADLRMAQQQLDEDIEAMLQKNGSVTVERLMDQLGRGDGEWPSAIDVQVHLQRRVKEGALLCVDAESRIQLNPA